MGDNRLITAPDLGGTGVGQGWDGPSEGTVRGGHVTIRPALLKSSVFVVVSQRKDGGDAIDEL